MGNTVDKIEDNLWLGDKHTYEYPEYNERFKTIVTAMLPEEVAENRIQEKVASRSWLHIPIDDDYRENISEHFLKVIQFIDSARKQGQCVLVHCAGGISRSSTLVCAYLMWEHGWTRRQAIEYVTTRRKIIDPNDGFMDQLLLFEGVLAKLKESQQNGEVQEKVGDTNNRQTV
jgi:protein-tyrosine phosphatase